MNYVGFAILIAVMTVLLGTTHPLTATPHDPYTYWLPSGSFEVSKDAVGEQKVTVELRETRMGVPDADLVIVNPDNSFVIIPVTKEKDKKTVEVTLADSPGRYRFYLTRDFREIPAEYAEDYRKALNMQFSGNWKGSETAFRELEKKDPDGVVGRLARARARYSRYELKSAQPELSAQSRYLLGMYCMENGFWEGAVREFEKATALDPENADAWYMLADALAYRDGDTDNKVEPLVPLYRKSAELREVDPNIWNIYVGIFRKMWVDVDDGRGGRTKKLMEMSQENVDRIRKEWNWVSTILWAASRGNMKFRNTFKVFDQEFDNTDPHAFDKLWKPGEQDVFMKFFEGGPANALGMDCGPNRTAVVDIGTWCGWEVYLHEWNHTLDWSMITSENGKGVPVTHSSDWCGFQPIPSMGRGHASCNYYYMTSGMFQTVKGVEPTKPGYNTRWQLYGPYECKAGEGLDTEFAPETAGGLPKPVISTNDAKARFDWIDLKEFLKPRTENVVGYASSWVYSPVRQKVRMWIGMNDGIKVWVNGKIAYGGIYKSIVLWDEANEPDQLVPSVVLEKGWNSVLVKVENLPKTPEQLKELDKTKNGWGFSLRICGLRNEELDLKWSETKPDGPIAKPAGFEGKLFDWKTVADDPTTRLPCLSEKDLAAYTGLADISISKQSLISTTAAVAGPLLKEYNGNDRTLNNLLNWRFESAAVLRYSGKDRKPGDLVFLRPEAYETYMRLMRLPEGYGIKSHTERVLGYVLVKGLDDHPNGRIMLVLDTFLGDTLPVDEKELLDISKL